jgi:SRSO17 transposase
MSVVLVRRIGMDARTIKNMGRKLRTFLAEFDDCFSRSDQRAHLQTYINGQLSDLERKSIEPIALAANVPPRTLQYFLSSAPWDGPRLRDRVQWIVARDHSHPRAIGIIDESGNPKKGDHTAGVQRQWCGNTGKLDNCVVAVHLAYAFNDFRCLLDSDLFLPKEWADDPKRRKAAGIPEDVVYRKKGDIALEQISRAIKNGIRFSALTFDELYGRDGQFLDGLDALGQDYVGEIPSDFTGWLHEVQVLQKPTAAQRRKRGRKRHFPRLAKKALPACEVRNLAVYSRVFQRQKWERFRIKDGEKGPIVWEVKYCRFYRKHGTDGLPGPAHTLIVARNVLEASQVKYFLSNRLAGSPGVTLEWLLWVAFSRPPIERCFELGKSELGMDHFEVRSWGAIHRHFYVSQLSQLFCARVHQQLREKNPQWSVPDRGAGSHRGLCVGNSPSFAFFGSHGLLSPSSQSNCLLPTSQPTGSKISSQKDAWSPTKTGHKNQSIELLYTA